MRTSFVVAAALALGCGPSVQGVHQSNLRFEHCNRLDLDGEVAPTHRLACWREWLRDPTIGQSDDRRAYAAHRITAIEAGELGPLSLTLTPLASSAEASGAPPVIAPLAAPAPLDPHASPPAVVAPVVALASADASASAAPARVVPAAACQGLCTEAWTACGKPCDEAPKSPACLRCTTEYRACMRRCFK